MSAELDHEISQLPVNELIRAILNLKGYQIQLGDSASSEELLEIKNTYQKLKGFVLTQLYPELFVD